MRNADGKKEDEFEWNERSEVKPVCHKNTRFFCAPLAKKRKPNSKRCASHHDYQRCYANTPKAAC